MPLNIIFLFVLLGVRDTLSQNQQQQHQQQQQQQQQEQLINQYPIHEDYNKLVLQTSQEAPSVVYHFTRPQIDPFSPSVGKNIQRQGNTQEKDLSNEEKVRYFVIRPFAQNAGGGPVLALQAVEENNEYQPHLALRPLQLTIPQQQNYNEENKNYNQQPRNYEKQQLTLPAPPPEYQIEKSRSNQPVQSGAHVTYLNPKDSYTPEPPTGQRPSTRVVIRRPQPPTTRKPYQQESGGLKQSDYTNIPFTQQFQAENHKSSPSRISYPVQYFPPPPANRNSDKYLSTPSRLQPPSYPRTQSNYGSQTEQSYGNEPSPNSQNESEKDYEEEQSEGAGYNDISAIPGDPGKDYPVMSTIPSSTFSCSKKVPGYYADKENRCQVYYFCDPQGHMRSFLCPNGTVFNQLSFVCEWWYNVDCGKSEKYYSRNNELYKVPEKKNVTQDKPVYFFVPRSHLAPENLNQYRLQDGSAASYPSQSGRDHQTQPNYQQARDYRPQIVSYQTSAQSPPFEYRTAVVPAPPAYKTTVPNREYREPDKRHFGLPQRIGETYSYHRN